MSNLLFALSSSTFNVVTEGVKPFVCSEKKFKTGFAFSSLFVNCAIVFSSSFIACLVTSILPSSKILLNSFCAFIVLRIAVVKAPKAMTANPIPVFAKAILKVDKAKDNLVTFAVAKFAATPFAVKAEAAI